MSTAASSVQACPNCGSEVELAEFEPLASVECPACQTPIIVSPALGPYELVEALGRGGMGVVYRAIDRQLDRQVALKVLRNDNSHDEEFIRKLEEEAAITGGINHPHVVKVYTTGTAQGRFYIAMELVDRGTLDDLMEVQGRIAEVQALEIASQIAQGLRAASAMGLIHRDVKPGNILFADAHSAKIVDFGLAILQEASTGTDEIWGTPYYVSPERLDHKPEDFRSDMYSLGATIFHAIAGRPPFEAEDATRVALKHLKSQAVSLQAFAPWVAGSTAFVINRMLQKDPDGRYGSYDELIEQLEYARTQLAEQQSQPAAKKRVVLETDADKKLKGQITVGILAFALLLGIGLGAYFIFWAPKKPEASSASAQEAAEKATPRFEAARQLVVAGKAKEGADAFHAISDEKELPAVLVQWALLQETIGRYLANDATAAQSVIEQMHVHPYEPTDPSGRVQADFFRNVVATVKDLKPGQPPALEEFGKTAYGSLALLLVGLKSWTLGDFDTAHTTLRDFQLANPKGGYAWIAEYQKAVDPYTEDLTKYQSAITSYKNQKTAANLRKAAVSLVKTKKELRPTSTALADKLEETAQEALRQANLKDKK